MNTFRHGLLKERAEKIRPDLDRAREVIEKAEAKHRDLTPEEKAATEPVLKEAKDIAAGFRALREQDATKEAINAEFADVMGPLDSTPRRGVAQGGPAAELQVDGWPGCHQDPRQRSRRGQGTGHQQHGDQRADVRARPHRVGQARHQPAPFGVVVSDLTA